MLTKLFFLFICTGTFINADVVDVYLFGGQSNMKGIGKLKNLPAEKNTKLKNVFFFTGKNFKKYRIGNPKKADLIVASPERRV